MTPVGGSDSHSHYLRDARMFGSLSGEPYAEGLRDGIAAGRVCVRAPSACSLEVAAPGGPWVAVGGAVEDAATLEARAQGGTIEILVDGVVVGTPKAGVPVRVPIHGGQCSVVRAHVDEGFSAPIYVNCPFADR